MKRRFVSLFPVLFVAFLVVEGCRQDEGGGGEQPPQMQGRTTDTLERQQTAQWEGEKKETGTRLQPSIEFDYLVHDFGETDQGSEITHVFPFKNTGEGTLIIEKITSS